MTTFPWREHSSEELHHEFCRLTRIIKKITAQPYPFSVVGYKCSNYFFQHERMMTQGRGTRQSTTKFWEANRQRIIEYGTRTKRDFFSCLNFINHAPAQFPPVTAGRIYELFKATQIFDPYAGWGDRCIAALALGLEYTGVDSNENLKPLFEKMIDFYGRPATLLSDRCENIDLSKISFDLVLSSPPFWNNSKLLEKYQGTEPDYHVFLSQSLVPIINKCRKRAPVCMYVSRAMYDDIKDRVGECDEEVVFHTSHCRTGRTHNIVYCWK